MLGLKSLKFLFSRRIRPLLKAPQNKQVVEKEEQYLDIETIDSDKRDDIMKKLKNAQEELMYK